VHAWHCFIFKMAPVLWLLKQGTAAPVAFKLMDYDASLGGGRLNEATVLRRLGLGALQMPDDERPELLLDVPFAANGLSLERFMSNAEHTAITVPVIVAAGTGAGAARG
jgi:hypothetical protein